MTSGREASMTRTDHRATGPAGWLLALAAVGLLSGCTAWSAATAAPGARPGVDVPRHSASTTTQPLGAPPAPPVGEGGYTFLRTHDDGSPVTFDPCRPVHVVVRPDNEPVGGRDLLLGALADLTAATGLQFVDDGTTDEAPVEDRFPYQPDRYGDRWAPVLVAWSTAGETTMLGAGVLGRAGPDAFGKDAESLRYVSGTAVFDGPAIGRQLSRGEDDKARAVLLHELGHLVGLSHVTDPYQVMYDTNVYPLSAYRSGDLRGLAELGLGRCFDDY
jgi:hypothetical protein